MRQLYVLFKNEKIWRTVFAKLSWSHLERIILIKNESKRNYYINSATENNFSVRQLIEHITSNSYERLVNKENIKHISYKVNQKYNFIILKLLIICTILNIGGNKMTLVILAAGLGSRFGGLKQLEGVGPNNEFIIDYSIYDAIEAGFTKVVIIIKEENYELFKKSIGSRWENKINIEYAFQNNKGIEDLIPKDRVKPLGTLHAIVCAKENIDEDFAIINADDFYGRDTFIKSAEFIKSNPEYCASLPYILKNTLSENGTVNRGVCEKDLEGFLTSIEEERNIKEENGRIFNETREFNGNEIVSMNCFCIKKALLDFFDKKFQKFLNTADLSKDESYIPVTLSEAIEEGVTKIKIVEVNSKWHGITNREDLPEIKKAINNYILEGIYPENIWQ